MIYLVEVCRIGSVDFKPYLFAGFTVFIHKPDHFFHFHFCFNVLHFSCCRLHRSALMSGWPRTQRVRSTSATAATCCASRKSRSFEHF
jgi:hypothetical protein